MTTYRPWNDTRRREFAKSHAEFLAKVWFREQTRDLTARFYVWHKPGFSDVRNGAPWSPILATEDYPGLDERRPIGPVLDPTWGTKQAAAEIEKAILIGLLGEAVNFKKGTTV